ncbi:MAG: enoyl-CoA hydratase [Alphaproteobacteria bacterium]|nr:enoyl-CoA hydratase [Alphaproteobacteria bacterium]
MSADPLQLDASGQLAVLTLNRPDKRNAMTLAMWRELPALLRAAASAPHVRALAIRGEGGHFCAGADISEFDVIYANRAEAMRNQADVVAATRALEALDMPTIAAIEGACVGGGCAIALACDLRLASIDAQFGITPARLGLVYGLGDTRRLVEAVGAPTAKDMLFTGRLMDSREALMCGLIDRLFPSENFVSGVQSFVDHLLAASRVTATSTKRIMRMIASGVRDDGEASLAVFGDAIDAPDFAEGKAAFREKRPPKF